MAMSLLYNEFSGRNSRRECGVMDFKLLLDTPPWTWPQGLDGELLPLLLNQEAKAEPADRLAAVEVAGDFTVIDDALAGALIAIVENPSESEELRATAAIALGPSLEQAYIEEFDDPESVPISEPMFDKITASLRKVYFEPDVPKLVRRRILEAAVRAPQEWHSDAIRNAYADPDPEWQLTAVFCMEYVDGFDQEILQALTSQDPETHLQAVSAAGAQGIDAAWLHISALASSESTETNLRLVAIDALSSIRPADSIIVLAGTRGFR